MRHGTTNNRRQRGRGNQNRRGSQNRMQVFDSNGPDVRIRGTAHQVHEKYMTLAKDATSSGDIILAESYLQHAEHYQRIINEFTPEVSQQKQAEQKQPQQPAQKQTKEDDLSLPSSILGKASEVSSQEESKERTAELSA